ncbi:MAG TPA: thiamine phosphate synthase [Propionibacteriaceae bacterium]|nr:thiamine phosphate synthase [Propionibacteriaceae bacterium]
MTVRMGVATRLKLAKLMLITGSRRHSGDLVEIARAAITGGVDIIQLRASLETAAIQISDLVALRQVAGDSGLVSGYGNAEYADAARVDLLQLSALDGPAAEKRGFVAPSILLGRSCHAAAQVDAAIADPEIAFFTISPVYNSTGTGEAGLELVRYAAAKAPLGPQSKPWFAVGGVGEHNVDEVLQAGARRIGVTRAVLDAHDPMRAATTLRDRLTEAWTVDPGSEELVLSAFGG